MSTNSTVSFPCRLEANAGGGESLYRAAAQHAGLGQDGCRELRRYCHAKLLAAGGGLRLVILASRDIELGEELLIDYGDRSAESLKRHPWLAT